MSPCREGNSASLVGLALPYPHLTRAGRDPLLATPPPPRPVCTPHPHAPPRLSSLLVCCSPGQTVFSPLARYCSTGPVGTCPALTVVLGCIFNDYFLYSLCDDWCPYYASILLGGFPCSFVKKKKKKHGKRPNAPPAPAPAAVPVLVAVPLCLGAPDTRHIPWFCGRSPGQCE